MINLKYFDSIRMLLRSGKTDDPYISVTEQIKIINNKASLNEVPDIFSHIQIDSYVEVYKDNYDEMNQLASNQFYVEYGNAMIYFNPSEEGKTLTATYKGKGVMQYPAERIWVHSPNPWAVDNLQQFVDFIIAKTAEFTQFIADKETELTNFVNGQVTYLVNKVAEFKAYIDSFIFEAEQEITKMEDQLTITIEKTDECVTATTNAIVATNNAVTETDLMHTDRISTRLIWQNPVNAFLDIEIVYPNPNIGWAIQTLNNGNMYRWDGTTWEFISNLVGVIPPATETLDGLMPKEYVTKIDNLAIVAISGKSSDLNNNAGFITTSVVDSAINTLKSSVSSDGDTLFKLRGLIGGIQTLLNSNDVSLDSLQEIVDYIKNNKTILDGVTINKVNVADIIDDLVHTDVNKPLSASQGRILKSLIDNLNATSGSANTLNNFTANFIPNTVEKSDLIKMINELLADITVKGSGDMMKNSYDKNNDGKVDLAEVADSVDWTGITSKPTSSPSLIDEAVADRHSHPNKTTIDNFTDVSGVPYYNGVQIATGAGVTKVSQLINDNGFITINSVSGKADKVATPVADNILTMDESGNLRDSGHKTTDFAPISSIVTKTSQLTLDTVYSQIEVDDKFTSVDDKLALKTNDISLSVVSKTGNYSDLIGKPTIPTKLSELTDDAGFITSVDIGNKADKITSPILNNILIMDINGNLKDSSKKTTDFMPSTTTTDGITQGTNNLFMTSVEKSKLDGLNNLVNLHSVINSSSDFPLIGSVSVGDGYIIKTQVTDNNPSKTNTGQTFSVLNEIIVWGLGGNWIELGATSIVPIDDNATSGSAKLYSIDKTLNLLSNKVDKVAGKQLSTEDYTTAEKNKLSNTTIVSSSTTNGNIKINNVETPVFALNNNTSIQKVNVDRNGVLAASRKEFNLIEGNNISLSIVDNPSSDRIDITINSSSIGSYTNFVI